MKTEDWEKIRAEAAVAAMQRIMNYYMVDETVAKEAIDIADELVRQLQKRPVPIVR